MMIFNSQRGGLRALMLSCSLLAGTPAVAQDLTVPADPVAAIEGDWSGIWEDWSVTVTNGRVVLTKGDPKTYSWLPVGTVLGVLNNDGKLEKRLFRFSGSTCLNFPRDKPPSEYNTIPCGDFGAVLTVFADAYELRVSGISLRRSKAPILSQRSPRDGAAKNVRPRLGKGLEINEPLARNASNAGTLEAETPAAQSKYIEVQGPNGTIRLSPEVIARNEAAAAEHRRKVREHEEEVARVKSDYEARLAKHREKVAEAAAATKEHEAKVSQAEREAAAHNAAMNEYNRDLGQGQTTRGAVGIMQAYGMFRETREAALESLMLSSKTKPELFDIQCSQSRPDLYKKPWACWGSYRQVQTRSSVSKQ